MKFLMKTKLSKHKYKDNNGYLICTDAVLARTGKQTYRMRELFPDGDDSEIQVDRPYNEVFDQKALTSFENCPLCVEHPEVDVTPENYNELAVGFVRNIRQSKEDGNDVMIGDLVITNQNAIDLVESGDYTDLSCGYNTDIIKDDASNYKQVNIRGNHVALCSEGRAGIARIIDSANLKDEPESKKEEDKSTKIATILTSEFKSITGKVKDYHKDVEDYLNDIKTAVKEYGEDIEFDIISISDWTKEPKEYRRDIKLNVKGYDLPFIFTVYLDREAWEPSRYDVHFINEIHDSEDFIRKDKFTDFENLLTDLEKLPLDETMYPFHFQKIIKKFTEDNKPINFIYTASGEDKDGVRYRLYKVTGFDKSFSAKIFNDGTEIRPQLIFTEVASTEDCVHNGFPILKDGDKYLVEFEGIHHEFDDCDSAKKFIDSDIVDKAKAMLRDKKIKDTEYSKYFKKELENLLEKKEQEVEETKDIDNPQTKNAFKETKKNLLQTIREQIAKLNENK